MSEIAVIEDKSANRIAELSAGDASDIYSSIVATSFKEKIELAKLIDSSEPVEDHLNKEIKLVHIVVTLAEYVDAETGEVTTGPRTTLIDEKGKSYHASSTVLFNDIRRMIKFAGEPSTWEGPIPIKITREGMGTRKFFTLNYV